MPQQGGTERDWPRRVGFIGLGDMGGAMAARLIDQGWPLAIHARRDATLEPFCRTPAQIMANPRELGAVVEALALCVTDGVQVEDVLFGPQGAAQALAPGSVVLIHSTIAPAQCRDFGERLARLGVDLLDAPVTGGSARARQGLLTMPLGGEPDVIERCLPLLEACAATLVRAGGLGCGQAFKLINNGLFALNFWLADEASRIAADWGLDRDALFDLIEHGSGSSLGLKIYAHRLRTDGGPEGIIQPTYRPEQGGILGKDLELLAEEIADRPGADRPGAVRPGADRDNAALPGAIAAARQFLCALRPLRK